MNERIKQLAEQAAKNYTGTFKWEYLPDIDKKIFEKFAELIVRKVFDCIADEGFEVYEPVIQSVKERFGIEE